jgi:hypothetical protein
MRWVCAGPGGDSPQWPRPLVLPTRPVVNDRLTLPLAERLELVQTL